MLKRMEKKGLIFRSVDENDKRISRVYLTSKAEDILKQIKDSNKRDGEHHLVRIIGFLRGLYSWNY